MSIDEAKKVLQVSENPTPHEIKKKYFYLVEANDKSQGGSDYLQSKVSQAKEILDIEQKIKESEKKTSNDATKEIEKRGNLNRTKEG